jgi:hypothetical protein
LLKKWKSWLQKQKARWSRCASGLKKIAFSESLSTPQRARQMAMMVAVDVVDVVDVNHKKIE